MAGISGQVGGYNTYIISMPTEQVVQVERTGVTFKPILGRNTPTTSSHLVRVAHVEVPSKESRLPYLFQH